MSEHQLKEQICDIGRRLYAKGFAAANDGNLSIRLNDKEILCTPTMVSKGFLKPEDVCKVDYEGKQLVSKKEMIGKIKAAVDPSMPRPLAKRRNDLGWRSAHAARKSWRGDQRGGIRLKGLDQPGFRADL